MRRLLAPLAVDAIFAPAADEVYPDGFATNVRGAGHRRSRWRACIGPGHFDGVATVVAKLFGMTLADRAYFGEKDWQQLQVVRRMARGPEHAGRGGGLPDDPRGGRAGAVLAQRAAVGRGAGGGGGAAARNGGRRGGRCAAGRRSPRRWPAAKAALLDAGFERVEYIDLCDAETLLWIDRLDGPARLLAAAWVGGVRLIDNIAV